MRSFSVRFLVLAGSTLLLLVLFIAGGFVPNIAEMGELDLKVNELRAELAIQKKLQPSYQNMEATLAVLSKQATVVKPAMVTELPRVERLPALVTRFAEEAGLKVMQIEPNLQTVSAKADRIEVVANFNGSLEQMEQFLGALASESWFSHVRSMNLEAAENSRMFRTKLVLRFKSSIK